MPALERRVRRTNTLKSNTYKAEDVPESVDFKAALATFLKDCSDRNLSPRTLEYYTEIVTDLTQQLNKLSVFRPVDVKTAHIMDIVVQKREGRSDETINKYIRGWKAFFNFLRNNGYLMDSPFDNVKKIKSEKKLIHTFNVQQIKALLDTPNRNTFTGMRTYTIMLTFLDTGIRLSELENLKTTDIYWKERQFRVYGKGRKERLVPFSATLDKQLREYLAYRGPLDHDYVFINIDNKPFLKRGIQQAIKEVGKESGIRGVRVSCHTFRHTFAKQYIINGGDAFSLQRILGHTSLDMVRVYVAMFGVDLSAQHAKYSPLEHLSEGGEL
ncbi:tyrosine-type recombinase/integrase [Paenibacillus shunpengii]|uniref:Tyrosine-type recombinase/integrase n=1 Tax=Paenibacillus shunpengii TaxID=2054424 RepID=A0ABW5SSH2_9BACL